jgi:hypothetical protein
MKFRDYTRRFKGTIPPHLDKKPKYLHRMQLQENSHKKKNIGTILPSILSVSFPEDFPDKKI